MARDPNVVRFYRSRKSTPWDERFWAKVAEQPDGCWVWLAATDGAGYGAFCRHGTRVELAHRIAYEYVVGLVPAGLQLDHLCRNQRCVNPSHLEPVTTRENTRRGLADRKAGAPVSVRKRAA